MSCITRQDSSTPSAGRSRTRTAPSTTSRAHSASSAATRSSPTSPVPTRTSRCNRFLTTLPSGTRWKNRRGPTPVGSTHANADPWCSGGSARSNSSQVANPSGGGGTTYPNTSHQKRATRSGSAQSKVTCTCLTDAGVMRPAQSPGASGPVEIWRRVEITVTSGQCFACSSANSRWSATASSRVPYCMMAQPPTTSLASAYGPSTRLTSPLRTTKFTASSVPNRPPPSRNTPFAARSPMWASIASNSACGGVPRPSSILTKPMKRGISITPTRRWGAASRTYVERWPDPSTSTPEVSPKKYVRLMTSWSSPERAPETSAGLPQVGRDGSIASHHVRLALFPLQLDSDRTGYVDILWVHLAYLSAEDGVQLVRALLRDQPHYSA